MQAPLELVGPGSSSSMNSFASLMKAEWIWKNDDWRCHFKEKMSHKETIERKGESI